jgi:hypothetical protein
MHGGGSSVVRRCISCHMYEYHIVFVSQSYLSCVLCESGLTENQRCQSLSCKTIRFHRKVALLKCAVTTLGMVLQPQHTEALKKCLGKPGVSYRNPKSRLKWSSNVIIPAYWGMETLGRMEKIDRRKLSCKCPTGRRILKT